MKKERVVFIMALITIIISSIISVYAANYLYNSQDVEYDNIGKNITSTNVQGAIDELYAQANDYTQLNERITNLENTTLTLDKIYPVGSIYISTSLSTVSQVQEKFGGTWEVFAQGRTLIGSGTGTDSNSTSKTFSVNSTGGEYTHKLTVNEMPSHNHGFSKNASNVLAIDASLSSSEITTGFQVAPGATAWSDIKKSRVAIASQGGNQLHNNIQPYITVYMYKRKS